MNSDLIRKKTVQETIQLLLGWSYRLNWNKKRIGRDCWGLVYTFHRVKHIKDKRGPIKAWFQNCLSIFVVWTLKCRYVNHWLHLNVVYKQGMVKSKTVHLHSGNIIPSFKSKNHIPWLKMRQRYIITNKSKLCTTASSNFCYA